MMMNNTNFTAAIPSQRVISIDLLRGFAVLGILIMNIQSFSMISAAYMNPTAWGDLTGINKWVWIFSHVFAADKFMSIFSILFGAGVLLFAQKAIQKGRHPASLQFRRMMWLLIFGLMHAYFIWYGDILVAYSLCGMLVFAFRNKKPSTLLIVGASFFIIPVLLNLFFTATISFWPQESLDMSMESWKPPFEKANTEIVAMRGSWMNQMSIRAPMSLMMQTMVFFIYVFWRVTAMMLLGMALYKTGVLSASKSKSFYFTLAVVGIVVGYFLSGWGVYENFKHGWEMTFSQFNGTIFNYFGSLFSALGYIGVVMLVAKATSCSALKNVISSVGRMAFTNYILMSLIGMFIFYGTGLGLFSQFERIQQIIFIPTIWILLMLISPLWLKNHWFGPLEWLWRVLTYWKLQPMKKPKD